MSEYVTWENELLSDKWELRESNGSLLASVDKLSNGYWNVVDRDGHVVTESMHDLTEAQELAAHIARSYRTKKNA